MRVKAVERRNSNALFVLFSSRENVSSYRDRYLLPQYHILSAFILTVDLCSSVYTFGLVFSYYKGNNPPSTLLNSSFPFLGFFFYSMTRSGCSGCSSGHKYR